MKSKLAAVVCAVLAVSLPHRAGAQSLDQLGNRASAIGAFVAVADDASAVAWNPSGLIHGPIFNILLDFGRSTAADDPVVSGQAAGQYGQSLLALGVPPLGLSYSRGRHTLVTAQFPRAGSAASSSSDREIRQVVVRSLVTSNLGLTLVQSIADGVTVGGTLKLVRGSLALGAATVDNWNDAFDQAEPIEGGEGRTTADVDLGAMVSRGRVRGGVVVRNATAPTFAGRPSASPCAEPCERTVTLKRHVRAGVAWGDGWPGIANLIVALDADLTRVPHLRGERRDVAAGAERWFGTQKFAVRGGLRVSTADDARPVASGGGSVAIRSGMYVDISAAWGRDSDARWAISARLMF
jgi:hypothetical protein